MRTLRRDRTQARKTKVLKKGKIKIVQKIIGDGREIRNMHSDFRGQVKSTLAGVKDVSNSSKRVK